MDHTARTKTPLKGRILRVIHIFRLFFRVEMIEITEELVEAVFSRQELILVAQVILAELPSGVT
jgi:hypothetical protein